MNARIMAEVWVAMTVRWRLYRSAMRPPSGEIRKTGICPAKPTMPSSAEEPVSRYTSQDCATFCIQVPMSEMSWPAKEQLEIAMAERAKSGADPGWGFGHRIRPSGF